MFHVWSIFSKKIVLNFLTNTYSSLRSYVSYSVIYRLKIHTEFRNFIFCHSDFLSHNYSLIPMHIPEWNDGDTFYYFHIPIYNLFPQTCWHSRGNWWRHVQKSSLYTLKIICNSDTYTYFPSPIAITCMKWWSCASYNVINGLKNPYRVS